MISWAGTLYKQKIIQNFYVLLFIPSLGNENQWIMEGGKAIIKA